jgi:integrase/recombinase XerD
MGIENSIRRKYRDHLALEKSLSENSIVAYLMDLDKLERFMDDAGLNCQEVRLDDLRQLMAQLRELGICPRSQARIVSGIKSFFRFLVLDEYRSSDPSDLLEGPKIGLRLPEVLTVDEINRIIASIDVSRPEGHRNRAMLEVLYSCGLRVSELVTLRFSDLFLDEGFIRVLGKGDKQRLVPVSPVAIRELEFYWSSAGRVAARKGFEDVVFIGRRGAGLSRIMVFHIIKEQAAMAGITKNVSPHTFRHSFATHLLEGGANLRAIQQMLGHARITATEIYVHIDRDFLRSEILEHHPRS